MARKVPLNTRFNRGVPERAYIKHLHVYTEGEITRRFKHDTQQGGSCVDFFA